MVLDMVVPSGLGVEALGFGCKVLRGVGCRVWGSGCTWGLGV